MISINFQGGFEITHMHGCFLVGLFLVCEASFLDNTFQGLLLNTDDFIYNF